MRTRWKVAALAAVASCVAWPAAGQPPPDPPTPPTRPAVRADILPRPRLRLGRAVSLEVTAKVQGDLAGFDPLVDEDDEEFTWRRRRLAIRGDLWNRVSFEIEREFGDRDEPWRDVYVNVRAADLFEVRGGKFKVPFGLDYLTGSTSHDFIFRALATRTLTPGRAVGAMVHGAADRRRVTYALGAFDGDDAPADRAFFDDDQGGDSFDRVVGGRVTVQPFDVFAGLPRGLRNLEVGGNGAWASVPAGLNGFHGRSVFRHEFFAPVYVNGDRVRVGADVAMLAGPVGLRAEWLSGWDERLGQGLGDIDLPKVFGRGWYVAGTWLVTGETKEDDLRPARPLAQGGIGAVELAARYERLEFGSTDDAGQPAFANPRAANLLRNRDAAWTVGVNWALNRWFKLQGNAIRESFSDPERAPIAGRRGYWSLVSRLQFAM